MILTKGKSNEINFDNFIENRIHSGRLDSLLILVPTNRKLRDLKKKIIDYYSSKPVSRIHIETLTTLSTNLLIQNRGFIPLSEAAASVLIKETTEELDLAYFESYSRGIPFGSLDRIKNVISEYKRHGITPSDIISESERLSKGEMAKALDISKIYTLYSKKCEELKAYELGDIYQSLLNLGIDDLRQMFRSLYNNVDTITLDGFDEFTSVENKLLNILGDLVNNEIFVNIDYYKGNGEIFSHLDDTHSRLIENGFRRIDDKTPEEGSKFREKIRRHLFNSNFKDVDSSFKGKIFKISARNRASEIEEIARIIKLKLIKEDVQPQRICIAFNSIGKYASIIRDTFEKLGIPYNLTDRITIKSSQPVIAAVSLVDLVAGDFYFKDIIRVLTNRFLTFEDVDISNILFTAKKLKILRGIENWEYSVDDAIRLLKYDDELTEEEKSLLEDKYSRAKGDIQKLAKLLRPLNQKNSKDDFITNFKRIILQLRLPQNILTSSAGREEEFVKSLTTFLNSLEEVLELVDSKEKSKKYSLHYFLDNIRTISNWARFNTKEKSDQGVLVTSVNEIRGLKFDLLFLSGMVDGDFPTKYSPEIFFHDSFQKKEHLHQTEERYHFYQSLCCWEKELYLTVPRNDSKTELVESSFIRDLAALIEYSESSVDNDSVILSKEELLFNYDSSTDTKISSAIKELGLDLEVIHRNIKIRHERKNDPFSEFPYSGFIGGEHSELQRFLLEHSQKRLSITQLETYAKCPFKYFAERILKLRSEEEPKEEVEPFELGNLLHSILYDFYTEVSNMNMKFGKPGTREFNKLEQILFNLAENRIDKLNLNSPLTFFEREKILGIDGVRENSILYRFLEMEANREEGFTPLLFEKEFGLRSPAEKKELDTALMIDDAELAGKIDRIDVDLDRKIFNVVDYKLRGRKPSLKDLKNGLSLQLPVYLKAGEEILHNRMNELFEGLEMIIYSLDFKQDNFGPLPVKLTQKKLEYEDIISLNHDQIKNSFNHIKNYHTRIKGGKFNLSELNDREEKVCKYCDYSSLCRLKDVFD